MKNLCTAQGVAVTPRLPSTHSHPDPRLPHTLRASRSGALDSEAALSLRFNLTRGHKP